MDNFFKTTYIFKLIFKWKWHLLIILAVAIVLSAVFSGPAFIKPKYKSYAVVYPANLTSYSNETPTEQLLQLLNSEDIVYAVIEKFKLYEHYHIDTLKPLYKYRSRQKFDQYISIRKTEYESVYVEALDIDPLMAYNIVNELINQMNLKARNLQREKTKEILIMHYNHLMMKQAQIDTIEARLKFMRNEYHILDYFIQTEELTKGMVKEGTGNPNSEVNRTLDNLRKYGGEQRLLESQLFNLTASYNDIKTAYDQALSDLNKELTYANIVTTPVPADKKTYPIRWLIVSISAFSALLLSLLFFSFIQERKKKKKPETAHFTK